MAIGFGPYWTGRGAGRLVVEFDSPELRIMGRAGMREGPATVLHEGLENLPADSREGNIVVACLVPLCDDSRDDIEHGTELEVARREVRNLLVNGIAVFFAERPRRAYLNDINAQLVSCYRAIKSNPDVVITATGEIDAAYAETPDDGKKAFYYDRRTEFNGLVSASSDDDIAVAALFLFLNRHCFNGLYRVNRKGLFNVPFNGSKGGSFSPEIIEADAEALQAATITNGDFLDVLARVQPGDFCFIDSPYAPLNPTSFESYAKEGFTEDQHRALAAEFRRLDEIGAKLMLTNHDTDLIRELYDGFDIIEVDVRRSINRNGDGRTGVEVIITNGYENRIEK